MPSTPFLRPSSELTTRFCFVCFDGKKALDAIKASKNTVFNDDFVKENCTPIIEGVERIKTWIKTLKKQ